MTNNYLIFQKTATIFSGLSDCHMLTVLKQLFLKINQKSSFTEIFKNYKNDFKGDLKTIFSRNTVGWYYQFDKIFLNVSDKHAAWKRKLMRANHSSWISKPLRKEITRRSFLEIFYYKNKLEKALQFLRNRKSFTGDCLQREKTEFQCS